MFSFSGLKTAVLYSLVNKGAYSMAEKTLTNDDPMLKKQVASSFLNCVSDIFVSKINKALQDHNDYKAIAFVGGVACNKFIRSKIQVLASKRRIPFFTPSPLFCTDNAAMIAFVGHYKAQRGQFSPLNFEVL